MVAAVATVAESDREGELTVVLAARRTSLIGREAEVAEVTARLDSAPMITLTGVGGVGKTSLAQEVARVLEERGTPVFFTDLTNTTDDAGVVRLVADQVGLPPSEDTSPQDALVARLCGEGRSLLLIDNCEHVLDGTAALVDQLLGRCPDLQILATSRERLGVDGEQVWPVHPLPADGADGVLAPAVRLLLERATAADPTWSGGRDQAALEELARRLDGVPLALELAAARLATTPAAELVDQLDGQLATLAGARRGAAARHRSLGSVVQWSVDLMEPEARELLARLSVFTGGFSRQAAVEIVGARAIEHLNRLVEASLVMVMEGPSGPRYRMLEMIRAFAREELDRMGIAADVSRAHAEWAARWVHDMKARMRGPEEAALMDAFDADLANLGQALLWACDERDVALCMHIAAGLEDHLFTRSGREMQAWIGHAVAVLGDEPGAEDLWLLEGLASMHRGDLAGSVAACANARARAAPGAGIFFTLDGLSAMEPMFLGRPEEAIVHMDRWRTAVAQQGPYVEAFATAEASMPRAYAGRTDEAIELATKATRLARSVGAPSLLAWCAYARGEALIGVDPPAALDAYREADELAASVRNQFLLGVNALARASALARYGSPGEAFEHFDRALDRFGTTGMWSFLSTTLRNLTELLVRVERYADATVIRSAVEHLTGATAAGGTDADRGRYLKAMLEDRLLAVRYGELVREGHRLSREDVTDRAIEVVRSELAGRRRGVGLRAVVFTDLESATQFTASRGDREARDIMRRYEHTTKELLARHRGLRVKGTGDGTLATFPSVSEALSCVCQLLHLVDQGIRSGELPLRLRVGVHAGEMIDETDAVEGGDIHGTVVNLTARVVDKADGGEVVVTDTVRQIVVGSDFAFTSLGEFDLKGIPEPMRLYRLEWRDTAE